jgi:hypothetical protein
VRTDCERFEVGSMWFTFLPSLFPFPSFSHLHSSHVVVGCFVDPFSKFLSGLVCSTSPIFLDLLLCHSFAVM